MLRNDIIRFIQDELMRSGDAPVGPDDSLIDLGVLDSLGLVRLMQFLETRTGVRIPDHMVTPDNFLTVAAMEQMLDGLRASA
jgi:acyl carrier protein